MAHAMSLEDFDRAVRTILANEFEDVVDMGLLSEETLLPVVAGMRSSLREAFPTMSPMEAQSNLQLLQQECRDTAQTIVASTDPGYWN